MKKIIGFFALLSLSACVFSTQQAAQTPQQQSAREVWVNELNQYAIDLRYVYGKKTGWLDFSHAFPYHTNVKKWTALNIWAQFEAEKGNSTPDFWDHLITRKICDPRFPDINPQNYFAVTYEQAMGVYGQNFAGVQNTYLVKKHLPPKIKEQVAYSIYMDVSYEFEDLQGTFPYAIGIGNSASSYSTEDLSSNAIGFFAVSRGGAKDKYGVWKYIKHNADLVPVAEAKKIQKVGFKQQPNKNVAPILYHQGQKQHLAIFDTPILKEGKYFINVKNLKKCE